MAGLLPERCKRLMVVSVPGSVKADHVSVKLGDCFASGNSAVLSLTATALACVIALVLDRLLGEPRRWHPLVGFGWLAGRLEARLNRPGSAPVWRGLAAVLLAVVPLTAAAALVFVLLPPSGQLVWASVVLWLALSLRGTDRTWRGGGDSAGCGGVGAGALPGGPHCQSPGRGAG